jgi:hypothetical protein
MRQLFMNPVKTLKTLIDWTRKLSQSNNFLNYPLLYSRNDTLSYVAILSWSSQRLNLQNGETLEEISPSFKGFEIWCGEWSDQSTNSQFKQWDIELGLNSGP